jgi:hypothetical protein
MQNLTVRSFKQGLGVEGQPSIPRLRTLNKHAVPLMRIGRKLSVSCQLSVVCCLRVHRELSDSACTYCLLHFLPRDVETCTRGRLTRCCSPFVEYIYRYPRNTRWSLLRLKLAVERQPHSRDGHHFSPGVGLVIVLVIRVC